jgi:hypothetical protein
LSLDIAGIREVRFPDADGCGEENRIFLKVCVRAFVRACCVSLSQSSVKHVTTGWTCNSCGRKGNMHKN